MAGEAEVKHRGMTGAGVFPFGGGPLWAPTGPREQGSPLIRRPTRPATRPGSFLVRAPRNAARGGTIGTQGDIQLESSEVPGDRWTSGRPAVCSLGWYADCDDCYQYRPPGSGVTHPVGWSKPRRNNASEDNPGGYLATHLHPCGLRSLRPRSGAEPSSTDSNASRGYRSHSDPFACSHEHEGADADARRVRGRGRGEHHGVRAARPLGARFRHSEFWEQRAGRRMDDERLAGVRTRRRAGCEHGRLSPALG